MKEAEMDCPLQTVHLCPLKHVLWVKHHASPKGHAMIAILTGLCCKGVDINLYSLIGPVQGSVHQCGPLSLIDVGRVQSYNAFSRSYKGYKGTRPQSRRLTASLFINAHEVMKKKKETGYPVGDVEM
eukprot:1137447-Pelagomonas_calceolata.AAC.4